MRLSYDWLKKYLNINVPVQQLAEKIERTVVEYDDIIYPNHGLKKIVVGKILSVKKHPNADHLNICQVDVGSDQPIQIICGAPNVRAGKKGIVALHGARVGGNVKIKRAKMRGVESNGMLCALDEIGFDKSVVPKEWQDGIYYLPDDAKIGAPVYPYLGMNDQIIDLDVTPNRGDMLSMRGIVHELAAIYKLTPHFSHLQLKESGPATSSEIKATADSKLAPVYKLRVVNHVKVQPSPRWLQIRLWNCGIQPVNNVVDATNYAMLKDGQPIHAYDLDKLAGHQLIIRRARSGEKMMNLNGKAIHLTPNDVVAADSQKVVALAGITGGAAANVTAQTRNVVLAAGVFDPIQIRKTAQRYVIHTQSSQRFERGVDWNAIGKVLASTAQLVSQNTHGQVATGTVTVNDHKVQPVQIPVKLSKINAVLGTDLSKATVNDLFERLGFKTIVSGDQFRVTVPTRRWDVKIAPDLCEEVAKLYGYNRIPSTLPNGVMTPGALTPRQKLYRKSRQVLEAAGLDHAISYTLTTEQKAKMFMMRSSHETRVALPLSNDHSTLRMNLISGLLDDVAYNQARKVDNVALFEQGRVFERTADQQKPNEKTHVAAVVSGSLVTNSWQQKVQPINFYQLKGIVDFYLDELGVNGPVTYQATDQHAEMHPGRTADVYVHGHCVGFIGQVHPKIAKAFHVQPTYVFELDLHHLAQMPKSDQRYQKISRYPAVERDVAVMVSRTITNQSITAAIQRRGGASLKRVQLFDVYRGAKIPDDQQSMAYRLVFQNQHGTLTDQVVDRRVQKIQKELVRQFHAQIR